MRKIALNIAMAGGLSSCFNAPFPASTATVTLPGGSTAAILTATTDSSGRTSATFDPNANYAQAIAASSGSISGSSVIFPPGALSIAVDLLIEEGSDLSASSALADLDLASLNAVLAAGTSVIIRPSSDAELMVPMSLSIPLPSGFGLGLGLPGSIKNFLMLDDPQERIAILARVWDPVSSELKTVLIPNSEIQFESGNAKFATKVFGAFQTVVMETPVRTRVEQKSSEPVSNASGASVVTTTGIVEQAAIAATESLPVLTVKSVTMAFDSESRRISASVTLSESVATTSCTLALRDKATGKIQWTASTKEFAAGVVPQIPGNLPASIAGYIESAASCSAVDGRNAKSTWKYLGQVCAAGYFGANCVACAAGTYWNIESLSCTSTGKGYFSTGNGLRQTCNNKPPTHSTYSSIDATSSQCPWTCDDPWIAAQTANQTAACAPTATLTGFPSGISSTTSLSGEISGDGIATYRSKVGSFSATECDSADGYSTTNISRSTPITNILAELRDGEITVCIVGVDESGAQQPYSTAAHATWTKDTTAPALPAIVSVAGATSFTNSVNTSNLTPVMNGTAEPNATVTVYNGDATLGTITANAAGAWTYTPSAAMANGTYSIKATATDASANVSAATAPVTLIVDNVAPAAPAITSIAENSNVGGAIYTNNQRPAITGTAETNSILTIYEGANVIGNTSTSGSGSWTFTPPNNLPSSTYTITTKATDLTSNQSAASVSVTLIIDTTAPAAPVIVSVAGATSFGNPIYTNDLTPAIYGTSEANATVTVYNGDVVLGTATATPGGAWTYNPTANLANGTFAIKATAKDAATNESAASAAVTLIIDNVAPAAPAITSIAENTNVASTIFTNNLRPTMTGTAEANAIITRYKDGNPIGSAITANGSGAWTYTPSMDLSAGTYALTAKATDSATNQSVASNAVTLTIDITPPTATVSGLPTASSNTTALQITVAGTDVTAYRSKSVAGPSNLCSESSGYSSETDVSTRITSNITTLADGSVTVCVVGRDAAGNWQTPANAASATWTKDTTAPVATLSGAPSAPSSAASLNVVVGGTDVISYRFKVGVDSTIDCTAAADYSSGETPVATPITASLSAIPAGSWTKLCVIGMDTAGNWQTTATPRAWQKVCAAGNYPVQGSCAVVGTGFYSSDGLTRLTCGTIPSNSSYSTNTSTTATCPWSCDVNYLLNPAQTACDFRPNTQAVSCPAGQVIVGATGRSGDWMDKLGVRCQTLSNGVLTGNITNGTGYGGSGGSAFTFDCPAGSYLYRITGTNGNSSSTTYLANVKFYCRSLTTDLPTTNSIQYGLSGYTSFDYSCPVSQPITSIPFDSAGAYVGRILQAYCGSNLK